MTRHFSILALIVIFAVPIFVSAAPSAGLKPTSFFYFLDTTIESIDLFFTFNIEKKAGKALAYAEERLAEIEAVSHDNAPQAVEKAARYYQKRLATATNNAQSLENKEKAEKLLATVSESTARHQKVLAEVYNSVPDEAKAAIEKVSEASKDKQLQALQFLLERKENAEERQNEEITEAVPQTENQNGDDKKNEGNNAKTESVGHAKSASLIPNAEIKIKQENNSEKQNKERAEIENLKREIEELKQKQITQQAPVAASQSSNTQKISSLPNGAVVELNEKGEIVGYIKQPNQQPTVNTPPPAVSQPSVAPAPQTVAQINTQPSTQDTPVQKLLITSVDISTERTSAKIIWETNKPTESKVFISGGNLSSKVFVSASGLSTKHIADVTGLTEDTGYSYEIEAIANASEFIKKTGGIRTLPPPPPPPEFEWKLLNGYPEPSENAIAYTLYNRTNKYKGYTSATIKIWQRLISNPHDEVRIRVSSPPWGNGQGNINIPAVSITGTTEDTALTVTVPLDSGGYHCASCQFMIVPHIRSSTGDSGQISIEANAVGVTNPNDRYFLKLISLNGETVGTIEMKNNQGDGTMFIF